MEAIEAEMQRAAEMLEEEQDRGTRLIEEEMKRAQDSSYELEMDAVELANAHAQAQTAQERQEAMQQRQLRQMCPELFDNDDLNSLAAAIAPPSPNISTGQGQ